MRARKTKCYKSKQQQQQQQQQQNSIGTWELKKKFGIAAICLVFRISR